MSGTASTTGAYRERNSTADRALDILMMFDETELVVSATAVAGRLGVARSTAYRYLQSLVSSRFLEEAPGGGFRLGLRVMEIARPGPAQLRTPRDRTARDDGTVGADGGDRAPDASGR